MAGELLHLAAPNDQNGNPRRTWLLLVDGAIKDGEKEGYSGKPRRFRDYMALRINVTASELRNWNQQLDAVKAWQAKVESLSGVAS